ncbi:MAG: hypothetical protein LBK71_03995 [Verrucomicrobiales bacterium]|nr:hypothetical protein [Verrucomicrobiales bacterium]
MKKVIARKTVTITISTSAELKRQIDARAAQLGRDRTSYLIWLAMKDLGLIPDEDISERTINTILDILELRNAQKIGALTLTAAERGRAARSG